MVSARHRPQHGAARGTSWRGRAAVATVMALVAVQPCDIARGQERYEPPKAIPITPALPMESPTPPVEGPALRMESPAGDAPKTLPQALQGGPQMTHALSLAATLAGSEMPIQSGLVWRIYAVTPGAAPTPVSELTEATPRQSLPQGNYIVHVSYGFASAMARVALRADSVSRLAIAAGGLRVTGAVGKEAIPDQDLTYSVYLPEQNNPEGRLVTENIRSGEIVRLPAGDYHVVSNYGTSNAIARADLSVEAGKVTDATINHRGARVTLKLVAGEGAEAFAGTAFSVLTPGGDTIHEEVGAFTSLILAEGDYVVVARHEGQVYSRDFTVRSGIDNDVEIVGR
ncbi:hypothetical protein ACFFJ7_08515 [Pseudochelatococcus lubricantis]|uniref:hypothetical protein n=1 Tax=Pseudochelatococcus lubricantis TaxID=1538102 RepID=UPI0035E5A9F6